jgi:hypothetical protein
MRRRTIWIVLAVLAIAAVVPAVLLLRRRAAPEAARLLPEADADAYLYFDLKPLRLLGVIGRTAPPLTEPSYEEFVRETGFQFERDLDEAALAVHSPPRLVDAEPALGAPAAFRRYSWVFRGHFDFGRAAGYFRKTAKSVETYRAVEVFSIPLEGRTERVALLGLGIAAGSNTDGPQAIHFMIDRYKQVALPFGGPSLVREYYPYVPFGALSWGIVQMRTEEGERTPLPLPGGLDLFFPSNTVVVASVRYTTAIQIRAEAFTSSPEEARQIKEQADAFLSIFHDLEKTINPGGTDRDARQFFESLQVEQQKDRTVLSASVPPAFLKKLFSETSPEQITGAPPEPRPAPPPKRKRK